ncbi:MAG: iron-containing alcohol dehydrogenase [bacterium]
MNDFVFYIPTRIIFGPGMVERAGEEAATIGRRALVVTGKSSARRTGTLDRVLDSLRRAGVDPLTFDKIEPNPRSATIDEGGALARDEGCDLIIGLGGGSAMDAAKGVAVVAVNPGSIWEYVNGWGIRGKPFSQALPTLMIPTMAATGSEGNPIGVISNWERQEKIPIRHDCLYPKTSIVDPELTLTVPKSYTAEGGVDILMHLLDRYLTSEPAEIPDAITESLVSVVLRNLPKALEDGCDIEARGNLSWASTLALTPFVHSGRRGLAAMHAIEHTLSAHYDVSHGGGLAAIFPHFMKYTCEDIPQRYVRLGRSVLGIDSSDDASAARRTIETLSNWMRDVGVYRTLRNLGIDGSQFDRIAEDTIRICGGGRNYLESPRKFYKNDIVKILRASLRGENRPHINSLIASISSET